MSRDEALKLARQKCPQNVVEHQIAVSAKAKEIAEKIREKGFGVDVEFVESASLLHDVGRCITHDIKHGIEGAEILKDYPAYARVCECHIGGGIEKTEAIELGLPEKDYLPETLEEKIICLADKLTSGEDYILIEQAIKKFEERLGKNHPTIKRIIQLDKEISDLMVE